MQPKTHSVPSVLAGPLLRRLSPTRVTLWLATRAPANIRLTFDANDGISRAFELAPPCPEVTCLSAGRNLHYLLVDVRLSEALPTDCWIDYQLELHFHDQQEKGWQDSNLWASDLCFSGRSSPGFCLPSRVGSVLHGSCRKPHHSSGDGLIEAERLLADFFIDGDFVGGSNTDTTNNDEESVEDQSVESSPPLWPSMLIMSGDQIYADDVAGPMLRAIHQVIDQLGIPNESFSELSVEEIPDSAALYQHPNSYYQREQLLPDAPYNRPLLNVLFGGVRKPAFTADNAHNHLISLAEYLVMYLMVWSPSSWLMVTKDSPENLSPEEHRHYQAEQEVIDNFAGQLSVIRRLFAHIPVAMIFDDHDLSDDWNLNLEWEKTVYGHPFSERIIGNGLLAYFINQGWGNAPEVFDELLQEKTHNALKEPGSESHDRLIEQLLRFDEWGYQWSTSPPLIVLDTRTRRWRSESAAYKPSGLLDWEAITDLQTQLRGQPSVLLVSAAPIFGVKLIEAIQRIFTWFGKSLMVDAENWMAHPGAANGILNVFRHPKTPHNFIVLSGDVHYSFVYDVELRGKDRSPCIWQICSSGLRNSFPDRLLNILDNLNRWLYAPASPLNWLTKRRRMRIVPRKPEGSPPGRRLLNGAGIGLVEIDELGKPWRIRQLMADGEKVMFVRRDNESHWH
ncbi:hypothetical protein [Motiliproteus sp. MSK22-1]|uniref:hypothetical protein n=1 Tax=Motiliproteus sp. MSK22-1 TaxID=1897630 RepID=UPI000975EEA5|nr:hypothetical protein [Motiliproteus sp. MSK22-1]OMH25552.1 hypothetical protein BGP75_23620 [Motiliproteus sp. MSK22-1]